MSDMSTMTAMRTESDIHGYVRSDYIEAGMSYGDYLVFLSGDITEWSPMADLHDLVRWSGLTEKDAEAFFHRLISIRGALQQKSIDVHNESSVRLGQVGHCVNYVHCWACWAKKSEMPHIHVFIL